ncbi:hypothetical protein N9Z31_03390, partial [Pseudomonadales bacterium]|nr:hypothetical protein [Pseudomonadales bacterium]
MAKLPGKTVFSGRRRITTRASGFSSHPNSTGGEYKQEECIKILIKANTKIEFKFKFPSPEKEVYAGYGGYFKCGPRINITIDNPNSKKNNLEHYVLPDWSKFGSMWKASTNSDPVTVTFFALSDTELSIYGFDCGLIWTKYFDNARPNIMKSMHKLSPEGNQYISSGEVVPSKNFQFGPATDNINLKSCNRCARFLPINLENERNHLSFSNHCVARAPCTHGGFGRLRNIDNGKEVRLHHGYQLECRFCKKYEVNAALNPMRTTAQMKEDGQRRRNFELLLTELYQTSAQLSYRHKTGRELAEDIWKKFNKQCFNCGANLTSSRSMHLDHTRPLALLWPLDETATALCGSCNSQKRDRTPSEFYDSKQLAQLAKITGLDVAVLKSLEPNHSAIREIIKKTDWLYDIFLIKPELLKEREGKITAE